MARLILTHKNQPQQSYLLTGEDTLIGTGPSCNIRLESTALHAEHARVRRHDGRWSLTAVEQTGQLRVNHGQSHEHLLKDGDIIHLDCYTLMFSDDGVTAPAESGAGLPPSGKLRVVSDRHFGRTISLDKPVTRFGRAGSMAAMISRRREGHYLAHLEGDEFPLVNHMEIGEQAYPLNDGDRITMGGLEFEFSTTPSRAGAHTGPATPDDLIQRHYSRVLLHIPGVISMDDSRLETRLIDISLSGALLELPTGWMGKTGEYCTLQIGHTSQPECEVEAEVRQIKTDRLGVAFRNLDEAGRQQVRWLVEINLGDTALLERELSEFA